MTWSPIKRFREWFRDEDGWTTPDGRAGEFVALLVALPVFVFFVTDETGIPDPTAYPFAVIVGMTSGFGYALYGRDRLLSAVPEWLRSMATSMVLGGGTGLSLLELLHLTDPGVLFILSASLTILGIYAIWLCSPFCEGIRPPRRGVEPPSSVESKLDSAS